MVAMSSTSIVVKVLADYRTSNTPAGQITIGTLILQARGAGWGASVPGAHLHGWGASCAGPVLVPLAGGLPQRRKEGRGARGVVPAASAASHSPSGGLSLSAGPHPRRLQDCLVGLLFALMPVLAAAGGGSGFDITLLLTVMGRVVAKLAVLAVGALLVARTVLPPAMRALQRRFGPDSFQLAAVAFCLLCALATARQGISAELGAFVAGVMLSATEQQESVLHNIGGRAAALGGAGVCV